MALGSEVGKTEVGWLDKIVYTMFIFSLSEQFCISVRRAVVVFAGVDSGSRSHVRSVFIRLQSSTSVRRRARSAVDVRHERHTICSQASVDEGRSNATLSHRRHLRSNYAMFCLLPSYHVFT